MTKKIISSILALASVLTIGSTAIAAESSTSANTVKGDATLSLPTLKLKLPTNVNFGVNPYKLEVDFGDLTDQTDKIISPEFTVENDSDCAVNIDMSISASTEGNATISTKALTAKDTKNSVFLYVEATTTKGTYAESYPSDSAKQYVFGTEAKPTVAKKAFTLEAKDATTGSGKDAGYFKICGDAVSNPDTAWAATDKISATIKFDIAPTVIEGTND